MYQGYTCVSHTRNCGICHRTIESAIRCCERRNGIRPRLDCDIYHITGMRNGETVTLTVEDIRRINDLSDSCLSYGDYQRMRWEK